MRVTAAVARVALLVALIVMSHGAHAQSARPYLDRDRIAFGESATLSVEATANAAPDYGPLVADFDLGAQGSRQQIDWVNGRMQSSSAYTLVLRPRHAGLLRIPPLRVGGQLTAPVTLLVTPATTAPSSNPFTQTGRDTFIESESDDQDPYVQQSVGWVVRLYTSVQAVSGELDQAEPANASLQRVGNDLQYRRRVSGRDYYVVERHYLLVPERSGELVMPPAVFRGRGVGNVFDQMFGDGSVELQAHAAPRVLRVRGIPADAPQPWLPMRALSLHYMETPQRLRAGSADTVVVEAQADGVAASQMPEIVLPASDGVQVFAERVQLTESVLDGRPHVRATRRFSLVPSRAGSLRLAGPSIAWWDVQAGHARTASLPALTLDVAPGEPPPRSTDDPRDASPTDVAGDARASHRWLAWRWPIVASIVALLLIMVGIARRPSPRAAQRAAALSPPPLPGSDTDALAVSTSAAGDASAGSARDGIGRGQSAAAPVAAAAKPPAADLSAALRSGDLAAIESTLRVLAPGGSSTGQADFALQLADAEQREAIERLRRARWAGGDAAAALAALRRAFAGGPSWQSRRAASPGLLAPLYPPSNDRDSH